MKRFFSALAGVLALGWSGMGLAQTIPATGCPTNFTCAFSAADTLAFGTQKSQGLGSPGQPDVLVGYLAFDASSNVTMMGMQNLNGTATNFSKIGTCAAATSSTGSTGTITFTTDSTQLSFVLDSSAPATATLLQFILTNDGSASKTANSVRVGSCHKLI